MFDAIDAKNARITAARASSDPAVRMSVAARRTIGPAPKQRIRATVRSALGDAVGGWNGFLAYNVAAYVRLPPAHLATAKISITEGNAIVQLGWEAAASDLKSDASGVRVGRLRCPPAAYR